MLSPAFHDEYHIMLGIYSLLVALILHLCIMVIQSNIHEYHIMLGGLLVALILPLCINSVQHSCVYTPDYLQTRVELAMEYS